MKQRPTSFSDHAGRLALAALVLAGSGLALSGTDVLAEELASAPKGAARGSEPAPSWLAPPFWVPPPQTTEARESNAVRPEAPAAVLSDALPFFAVTPCRLADTRGNGFTGAFGPPSILAGNVRDFPVTGSCSVPQTAKAVSLNLTVTGTTGAGFLSAWPSGSPFPVVSTLNFVPGQTIANAAVVPLGSGGQISILAAAGTDLIIDVNGYYAPVVSASGFAFLWSGSTANGDFLSPQGSDKNGPPNTTRSLVPMPVGCTVDAFYVRMDIPPTVITTFTLVNGAGAPTPVTCTIGTAQTTCNDLVHTTTYAAGEGAATSVSGGAGAGGRTAIGWRCK